MTKGHLVDEDEGEPGSYGQDEICSWAMSLRRYFDLHLDGKNGAGPSTEDKKRLGIGLQ